MLCLNIVHSGEICCTPLAQITTPPTTQVNYIQQEIPIKYTTSQPQWQEVQQDITILPQQGKPTEELQPYEIIESKGATGTWGKWIPQAPYSISEEIGEKAPEELEVPIVMMGGAIESIPLAPLNILQKHMEDKNQQQKS